MTGKYKNPNYLMTKKLCDMSDYTDEQARPAQRDTYEALRRYDEVIPRH